MAKKKSKKNKKTLVVFILDETGSMSPFKLQTIDGFNEYVNALRNEKNFSLMLTRFNTGEIAVGEPKPIKKAIVLNNDNYKPRHTTPLYDAIAVSIRSAEEHVEDAALVVIMTDGLENDSKEYKRDDVFKMIKDKTDKGWQFVFLGANQDAWAVGASLGVSKGSSFNYDQHKTGVTLSVASDASMRYARGGSKPVADFFNQEDRKEEAEPE